MKSGDWALGMWLGVWVLVFDVAEFWGTGLGFGVCQKFEGNLANRMLSGQCYLVNIQDGEYIHERDLLG